MNTLHTPTTASHTPSEPNPLADAAADVKTAEAYRAQSQVLLESAKAAYADVRSIPLMEDLPDGRVRINKRVATSRKALQQAEHRFNVALDLVKQAKRNLARIKRLAGPAPEIVS